MLAGALLGPPAVYARLFDRQPDMRALFWRDTTDAIKVEMLAWVFEAIRDFLADLDRGGDLTPRLDSPRPLRHVPPTLAGETGFSSGAEGATAPETLRQKDRDGLMNAGKQRRL